MNNGASASSRKLPFAAFRPARVVSLQERELSCVLPRKPSQGLVMNYHLTEFSRSGLN